MAIAQLRHLAGSVFIEVSNTSAQLLTGYVVGHIRAFFSKPTPPHENETIVTLSKRHQQESAYSDEEILRRSEEQNRRIEKEIEAKEKRRKDAEEKERLGQLQATRKEMDTRYESLVSKRPEVLDAVGEEERKLDEEAQEVEERRLAEAREAEEKRLRV